MAKNGKGIEGYLNRLEGRIRNGFGKNFVVFLDTCAIIDFENYSNDWKLKTTNDGMSAIYNSLCSRGFPVYVNKRVLQEVLRHSGNNFISGRQEISPEGAVAVNQMYLNYQRFMRNVAESNLRDIEDIRYDVHWATKLAFDPWHKKICDDVISRADKALIASAIWTRYASLSRQAVVADLFFDNSQGDGSTKFLDGVVIVSPDSHVSETVKVLTDHTIWPDCQDPLFTYDSIKVVSSRGD